MVGEALQPSRDFLLDTGIIMRHLRDDGRAHALLDYLEGTGEIGVSVVTVMEILVGCRTQQEEDTSLSLFDRIPPVIVSREVAEKAAALVRRYPTAFGKDEPRGFPDALIGATAWQRGSILVTLNTRHFARVPIAELAIQAIDQKAADWVTTLKI
ncbi:MAG: PIN domain-containing protein [Dehalococcoidia bacterium]|nr:PIN domain-containing protein [Dehalococcoidia bacterium]